MKRRLITTASAIAAMVATGILATNTPAQAYCTTPLKWSSPGAVKIRPGSGIPASWDSILSTSAGQWRGISGSSFSINAVSRTFVGPIYGGGFVKSNPPAGASGFGGAPGVTILARSGNTVTSAMLYLNPAFTWNTTGTMNQSRSQADVRTVTIHEIGHWLVLNHPNACGSMTQAEKDATMNPDWRKKWNTTSDDKSGAAAQN
jgi:hypothetical protein